MIKKKCIQMLCVTMLVLTGCSKKTSTKTDIQETFLSQYNAAYNNQEPLSNYTLALQNAYTTTYSDTTKDTYDMDGVLVFDKDEAHLTQHIDSNGMQSSFDGYWYDNRLYNTYNNVKYYEDMDEDSLKENLLFPLGPVALSNDDVQDVKVSTSNTDTTYNITLSDSGAKSVFTSSYDVNGFSSFDGFAVKSGTLVYTFEDSRFVAGKIAFEVSFDYEGETMKTTYEGSIEYRNIDTSDVNLSDDLKQSFQTYVAFKDIDTSTIQPLTTDDDTAEETTVATFKKRLVSRLQYTKVDDNHYKLAFNNDNETYEIDFDLGNFTYSERTIKYIYNWKSDQGSLGACTYDFINDTSTSSCKEETLQTIKQVKTYLEMELYYCGLTLSELKEEK